MRSIKWPNMFSANSTNVWKDDEYLKSTTQNVKLLLKTERGQLFGDPYFGILLKQYLFDQNNYILRDILTDVIYTQLVLFIPQLHIERRDISITQDKELGKLYCTFSGTNLIDFQLNTYNLVLYEQSQEQQ